MLINKLNKDANLYLTNSIIDTFIDFINDEDKEKINELIERYTNFSFFNRQYMISTTAFYRIIDYIKSKYNYQVDFQAVYNKILNTYDKNVFSFVNTNRGFVNLYLLDSVAEQIEKEYFNDTINHTVQAPTNRKVLIVEDNSKQNLTLARENYFLNYIKNLYKDFEIFVPHMTIESVSELYKDNFYETDGKSYINGQLMFENGVPTELYNKLVYFTDMLLYGKDFDLIININNTCPFELIKILDLINLDLGKVENIKLNPFKIFDNGNELSSDNIDMEINDSIKYEFMRSLLGMRLNFDTTRISKSIQFMQTLYSKICGLFKHAESQEINSSEFFINHTLLNPLEKNLLLALVCYQDKLNYIRKSCVYSELFSYLQSICTMFKKSYSSSRYIDKDNMELTRTRLTLARYMQYVLKDILAIYDVEVSDQIQPTPEYRERRSRREFTQHTDQGFNENTRFNRRKYDNYSRDNNYRRNNYQPRYYNQRRNNYEQTDQENYFINDTFKNKLESLDIE